MNGNEDLIHLVEPGAYVIGRWTFAVCGEEVPRKHGLGQTVTCPECLAYDVQAAAALAELIADDGV